MTTTSGVHGKNFGHSNFEYVPVFLYQGDEPDTYHFEPHYPWVIHQDHSDYAEFLRQRRDIRREVMDKNKWTALVVKRLDDLFTKVYAKARAHQIDKYRRKKQRVFISFHHVREDTLEQRMRLGGMELSSEVTDVVQAAGKFQLTLDRDRDRLIIRKYMRTRDARETELKLNEAYAYLDKRVYSQRSSDGDEDDDYGNDDEEKKDQHNVSPSIQDVR